MAQIKVLDLCDPDLLCELGDEDTKKVNGGAVGAVAGIGYSIKQRENFGTILQRGANGATAGGALGGGVGGAIGFFVGGVGAGPGAVTGGVIGAALH